MKNKVCKCCSWNCFNYKFIIILKIMQVCWCVKKESGKKGMLQFEKKANCIRGYRVKVLAQFREMCYSLEERETKAFGLPSISVDYLFTKAAVIIVSNGGYFRFPLKIWWHRPIRATMNIPIWINSVYVTYIGNALLSYVRRVAPPMTEGKPPQLWFPVWAV